MICLIEDIVILEMLYTDQRKFGDAARVTMVLMRPRGYAIWRTGSIRKYVLK